MHDACHKAFQNIADSIKFIEKNDIDCSRISDNTEKLPRELKGQILYNLVFRKYKSIPKGIGIPTNYQNLYDHYNKMKKETKK